MEAMNGGGASRVGDGLTERLEPAELRAEDADTACLVARFQAGDSEAFAQLYLRYFDRVFGYLKVVLRNREEAEDAAQQVFVKVLAALPRFKPGATPFRGWLFVIARNYVLNQLRRPIVEPADMEALLRDEPAPEAQQITALSWVSDPELQILIERLPLAQRQILFLCYIAGLDLPEVAPMLGLSVAAARKHHSRALKFLRDRLIAVGREPCRDGQLQGARVILREATVLRARRFALTDRG
jgi:RNA polymerase sigma-70 factor (ECF subfamily)